MVLNMWAVFLRLWLTDSGYSEAYITAAESQNLREGSTIMLLNHLFKDKITCVILLTVVHIFEPWNIGKFQK